MSFLKQLINILYFESLDYCNFCFKNMKDEQSYSLGDIITTKDDYTPFSIIMKKLFGAKCVDYCTTEIFCKQCTESMIRSYNFIKICKNNMKQLFNTISCIESGILSNVANIDDFIGYKKAIYIKLDPKNNSGESTYHKTGTTKTITSINLALSLSNINEDDFSENTVNNFNDESFNKTRKRESIKIPVNEIIYDVNNMSSYKCKICHHTYSNLSSLKQHFLRVHAPKGNKCTDCDKSFGSLSLLKQHKNDIHRLFICSECGKTYKYRSTFIIHMQSHTLKLVCQLCGKLFKNKRNFNNHMKSNICNLNFRKLLEKKYICDYCQKKYSNKNTLRSHISFEHGNGATHVCTWCSKKFNAVSRLTAHIVTHTQEKKFGCDICGGRYVSKESLRTHIRIHTGERPYQCQFCDLTFLSSSRRAEHNNRYHQNPNIDCDFCHSKFSSHASLVKHKKRHFNSNSRLHYTRMTPEHKEF